MPDLVDAVALADRFRVPAAPVPGDPAASDFALTDLPTGADGLDVDKADAKDATDVHRDELKDRQDAFYADGSKAMLIVLQAIDAGGKDSTVRRCFGGMNPAGVRVWSFKQPTDLELRHDFLWRHHHRCPARGMIGIHNRSHYEAVLIERVKNIAPEPVWRRRYGQINAFEEILAAEGTIVLKFFLHLSKDEQAARFRDRLQEPDKWWKFAETDLDERERWSEYQLAFRDALAATSTAAAPWWAIPADNKWLRDYLITAVTLRALREADSQYPAAAADMADRVEGFLARLG
jgi:PPK2 family polyphosphate:nucleotide phosphotransferase